MSTVAPPRSRPGALAVGPIIAVAFIAIAVVAVQNLAVVQGWTSGTSWTTATADAVDGLTATWWVVAIGVVLALIGLWLVIVALKPRGRSHLETALDGDIWLTESAVSALAVSAAEDVASVASATAKVSRRKVSVTAQSNDPESRSTVEQQVRQRLEGFSDRPVNVTIERVKDDA